MPQFFATPGPPATVGAAAAAPLVAAHLALVSAPELRTLDDVLAWMAHGLIDHAGFDRAMVLRTGAGRLAMAETAFSQEPELALEARSNAARHPVDLRDDGLELEMIRRRGPALVVPVGDARARGTRSPTSCGRGPTWRLRSRRSAARSRPCTPTPTSPTAPSGRPTAPPWAPSPRPAGAWWSGRCSSRSSSGCARACGPTRSSSSPASPTSPPTSPPPGPPSPAPHPVLTPRENEVLALMSRGATSREIARHLVLSAGTVKTHARSILRKMGAGTRAEAVALAFGAQPHGPRDGA